MVRFVEIGDGTGVDGFDEFEYVPLPARFAFELSL